MLSFHDTEGVRAVLTNSPDSGHQLEFQWDHAVDTPIRVCIESGGREKWTAELKPQTDGTGAIARIRVEDALSDSARVLLIDNISARSTTTPRIQDPVDSSHTAPSQTSKKLARLRPLLLVAAAVIVILGVVLVAQWPWSRDKQPSGLQMAGVTVHRSATLGAAVPEEIRPNTNGVYEVDAPVGFTINTLANTPLEGVVIAVAYNDAFDKPEFLPNDGKPLPIRPGQEIQLDPLAVPKAVARVFIIITPTSPETLVREAATARSADDFRGAMLPKLEALPWYSLQEFTVVPAKKKVSRRELFDRAMVAETEARRLGLGSLASFGPLHRAVGDYREALLGNDTSPTTADIQIRLSALRQSYPIEKALKVVDDLRKSGVSDADRRAIDLLRSVLDTAEFENDQRCVVKAQLQHALASVYYGQQNYDPAIAAFDAAVQTRFGLTGVDPLDAARTHRHRGMILERWQRDGKFYAGTKADPIPAYRQALASLEGATDKRALDEVRKLRVDLDRLGAVAAPKMESRPSSPELEEAKLAAAKGKKFLYDDPAEATKHFDQAYATYERLLGRRHYLTATCAAYRAMLSLRSFQNVKAEEQLRTALSDVRTIVAHGATAQSQKEQLAIVGELRKFTDAYLSLAVIQEPIREQLRLVGKEPVGAEIVYTNGVLPWKGAVFARQLWLRRARDLSPAAEKARTVLAETMTERNGLAALTPRGPEGDVPSQLARLDRRIDELDAALAKIAPQDQEAFDWKRWSAAQVRAALPESAALVDFVVYEQFTPVTRDGKLRLDKHESLVAFVVTRDAVRLVPLGPVSKIASLIEQWHNSLPRGDENTAGKKLRDAVWNSLVPYLGDRRQIFISPDGPLNHFPFAALPGDEHGHYLLEKYDAFVSIPVPGLLPDILRSQRAPSAPAQLVVRDVVPRPAEPPLKKEHLDTSSNAAIAAHKAIFSKGRSQQLTGGAATPDGVRRLLPEFTHVHIGAHGFFDRAMADDSKVSGLALTPTNDEAANGWLTAGLIAEIDLRNLRLAVVSSCQSARGPLIRGEGLLGVQRSFQVAGARTVVAALWEVNEAATASLMSDFYGRLGRGVPAAQALAEAQRAMLKSGGTLGQPQFWAAWVLSGNPGK
jgi:tetratricopeptide (TPR) repeat protein